jgi:hypothetical protein
VNLAVSLEALHTQKPSVNISISFLPSYPFNQLIKTPPSTSKSYPLSLTRSTSPKIPFSANSYTTKSSKILIFHTTPPHHKTKLPPTTKREAHKNKKSCRRPRDSNSCPRMDLIPRIVCSRGKFESNALTTRPERQNVEHDFGLVYDLVESCHVMDVILSHGMGEE